MDDERAEGPHDGAGAPDVGAGRPGDGPEPSDRASEWAATMAGHVRVDRAPVGTATETTIVVRHAHDGAPPRVGAATALRRADREQEEAARLARGATAAIGAGDREHPEEPDPWRTCFERDRDRILHGTAFRRLAGKTQVFVFPDDHQRTRMTHALEVAQVAVAISRALGLNEALTEAIALGHDCGHGPGGHASEDAFSPYVAGGYDHAVWGADVVLRPLNLCRETLDGIRNHSWSRPAPSTPEGEVVSWADRIAYVCHDFEDAAHVGITTTDALPPLVRERCGDRRSQQLGAFIDGVVSGTLATGSVGMVDDVAEALAEFRRCNYERIYMRPASVAQSRSVIDLLRALVEHFAEHPDELPRAAARDGLDPGGADALREAVTYVGGMTDRYAFAQARKHLGRRDEDLPVGIV